MKSALTDVQWVKTTSGNLTVRDALIRSSHIDGLDLDQPGVYISSTFRILQQVAAVALRYRNDDTPLRQVKSLDAEAVDKAIAEIGDAALVENFLQQPVVPSSGPKDTARYLAPGNQPVKKLLPFMAPDNAEAFWSLAVNREGALGLEDALRDLALFHHFSPAGNNVYDGAKCVMGSPGLRFPGQDNTATEVIVQGDNLLETILLNTPTSWVNDGGLPAWADRAGEPTPLWQASWSSNAPACLWEDEKLVAVRVGGIPKNWWHPTQGTTAAERKAWWDDRNTRDPLYLYRADKKGDLKAQRLDLQRDDIDLAVEWNAERKYESLQTRPTIRMPEDQPILFLRHQVGGTASSPAIRASEVLNADRRTWNPRDAIAPEVSEYAKLLQELHRNVSWMFRGGQNAPLDDFASMRGDVSADFWRNIAPIFEMNMETENLEVTDELAKQLRGATLEAFDNATGGHHSHKISSARAALGRYINKTIAKYREEPEA